MRYFGHWMKIILDLGYFTQQTINQNRCSNKILPWETETKTIYDHQATSTEDSPRNFTHRRWKQTKPLEEVKYQTTGEEKTSNHRVALIWLHTMKSLHNKNN
jgi:hypothetical protein